ncbi:hypothetical protein PGTUg99_016220 [Puccinia graminis f. sp. tritici]|uniref:Uncharacterized protein n=1 Tax=Puccinia graminis f. sp. tritici TaxID=56615 RepID=A0A5B0N0J9_PUCGR|nr:hypothetical protein PGTUg99_016220 [Puccinia graminis f. sp. tritici]
MVTNLVRASLPVELKASGFNSRLLLSYYSEAYSATPVWHEVKRCGVLACELTVARSSNALADLATDTDALSKCDHSNLESTRPHYTPPLQITPGKLHRCDWMGFDKLTCQSMRVKTCINLSNR